MSDLADFLEGRSKESEQLCPAARLVEEVREEGGDIIADQLARTLMDEDVKVTPFHAHLRNAGFRISRDSLRFHRQGICTCREGK